MNHLIETIIEIKTCAIIHKDILRDMGDIEVFKKLQCGEFKRVKLTIGQRMKMPVKHYDGM
jgi:hypothetical protein